MTDADDPEPNGDAATPRDSTDAEDAEREPSTDEESGSSGFLGNIKNARSQLGDAKDAFSNARSAGSLPTDEEGRVRLVCRRYEERRLAPLDDKGRPSCYEAGNEDCEDCVEAVREGSVETW
ncbi:hypothetical protein [Salinarchaeum sp. Harcht-Bsk1]|uniref:DUF7091 family protein n=1 Tax=Salinarchaeum sp. Harcht-Bsk1 TaxID=1333523 RepID=UPI0009DC2C1F|nr:hypothetical protein [Salinarchaeum sp. Harcht-Bsk1]